MSVYGRVKTGVPMHAFTIFGTMPNYRRWIQMLPSLRKFTANEAAQERLKIVEFYAERGEAETLRFFHVNRKTIHVWKQKLERLGHRLESLILLCANLWIGQENSHETKRVHLPSPSKTSYVLSILKQTIVS